MNNEALILQELKNLNGHVRSVDSRLIAVEKEVSDIRTCLKGYNGNGNGLIGDVVEIKKNLKSHEKEIADRREKNDLVIRQEKKSNLKIAGLYIGLAISLVIGIIQIIGG